MKFWVIKAATLTSTFFWDDSEDKSSMYLRNFSKCLSDSTVWHPKRQRPFYLQQCLLHFASCSSQISVSAMLLLSIVSNYKLRILGCSANVILIQNFVIIPSAVLWLKQADRRKNRPDFSYMPSLFVHCARNTQKRNYTHTGMTLQKSLVELGDEENWITQNSKEMASVFMNTSRELLRYHV
jgi:hypothetical protein